MGRFHPTEHSLRTDIPGELTSNIFGTMYLNLADLSDEIVVHECAHAAFAWEFSVRRYTGRFDLDEEDEQESYCYFLGKAVEKVKEVIKQNYKTGRRIK